jgi:lipopolysaccharide transport system ATP-binding protein
MDDVAVRVEGISKRYRVSAVQKNSHYDPLRPAVGRRETLARFMPFLSKSETIWALSDVTFDVRRGESLGVIGANGAGKSTLLKILARVTKPTSGRAVLSGRVGSLLEVGTGFHPELSGRDNIYLSGAILGMTKTEIDNKFDEIVEFSGVSEFIDTPVKRYSSGMQVRLAFSVSAHLDPEILLVDEVLSVGDAAFRQKSMTKMGSVTRENRTVIFVSHNLAAIEGLCDRAIYLEEGRLMFNGRPPEAVRHYLEHVRKETADELTVSSRDLTDHPGRIEGGSRYYRRIRLLNGLHEETAMFRIGDDICFELLIDSGERTLTAPNISIGIESMEGIRIMNLNTERTLVEPFQLNGGKSLQCWLHDCRLVPGAYLVKLGLSDRGQKLDVIENVISFQVLPTDLYGTGRVETGGIVEPHLTWDLS